MKSPASVLGRCKLLQVPTVIAICGAAGAARWLATALGLGGLQWPQQLDQANQTPERACRRGGEEGN